MRDIVILDSSYLLRFAFVVQYVTLSYFSIRERLYYSLLLVTYGLWSFSVSIGLYGLYWVELYVQFNVYSCCIIALVNVCTWMHIYVVINDILITVICEVYCS